MEESESDSADSKLSDIDDEGRIASSVSCCRSASSLTNFDELIKLVILP